MAARDDKVCALWWSSSATNTIRTPYRVLRSCLFVCGGCSSRTPAVVDEAYEAFSGPLQLCHPVDLRTNAVAVGRGRPLSATNFCPLRPHSRRGARQNLRRTLTFGSAKRVPKQRPAARARGVALPLNTVGVHMVLLPPSLREQLA